METSVSPTEPQPEPRPEPEAEAPPRVAREELLRFATASLELLGSTPFAQVAEDFLRIVEWDTRSDSDRIATLLQRLTEHLESEACQRDRLALLVLQTAARLLESYRKEGDWLPVATDLGAMGEWISDTARRRQSAPHDPDSDCLSNWNCLLTAGQRALADPAGCPAWVRGAMEEFVEKVEKMIAALSDWSQAAVPSRPTPEPLLELLMARPTLPVPKQDTEPEVWNRLVQIFAAWQLCASQTLRFLREGGTTVEVPVPMADRFESLLHERIGDPLVPGSEKESERIKEVIQLGFAQGGLRQKPKVSAYGKWGSGSDDSSSGATF